MAQSNLALLYENRVDLDGVTLSGGSWQTGSLGLANLRTPYLAEVARSMSTAVADTQFVCNLPQPYSIGGIALGPTDLRPSALVRFRSYADSSMAALVDDSGFIALPGSTVDQTTLAWEDPGFWEGITQEFDDVGKGIGKGATFIYVLPVRVTAATIKVEIFDPGNPVGYFDIGRFFVSRTWRPTYNYDEQGNSLDFEAITDQEDGRSGTTYYNARAMRRTFKFGFSYLPTSEYREIYQIAVRSGIHNQIMVVPNPGDPSTYLREAFFGTLGQPPSLRRMSTPYIATEFVSRESL
ncbi:hypothetical protein [Methylobacterium longum]|uniref:Uncharacterized protein n=1 Tax=Methylobacterium longum TaxID=767694 RepID=A0ABT8AQV2_9HYPH|nr:hypothetical protein [Methylobacterium longum]MDN3571801.1 hypothetical protein [Methylobacterium longum]GJE14002.1 hypothetical protein FOHLNKBM_5071 [Methylobacterium longum]